MSRCRCSATASGHGADGDAGGEVRDLRTMTAEWPDYDKYQRKTDRDIPVVLLSRRDG